MQVIVSDKLGFSALRKIKHQIRGLARARGIMHTTVEFCCDSEDRHQHH
jgi:hypothetical protein